MSFNIMFLNVYSGGDWFGIATKRNKILSIIIFILVVFSIWLRCLCFVQEWLISSPMPAFSVCLWVFSHLNQMRSQPNFVCPINLLNLGVSWNVQSFVHAIYFLYCWFSVCDIVIAIEEHYLHLFSLHLIYCN